MHIFYVLIIITLIKILILKINLILNRKIRFLRISNGEKFQCQILKLTLKTAPLNSLSIQQHFKIHKNQTKTISLILSKKINNKIKKINYKMIQKSTYYYILHLHWTLKTNYQLLLKTILTIYIVRFIPMRKLFYFVIHANLRVYASHAL